MADNVSERIRDPCAIWMKYSRSRDPHNVVSYSECAISLFGSFWLFTEPKMSFPVSSLPSTTPSRTPPRWIGALHEPGRKISAQVRLSFVHRQDIVIYFPGVSNADSLFWNGLNSWISRYSIMISILNKLAAIWKLTNAFFRRIGDYQSKFISQGCIPQKHAWSGS